MSDSLPQGELAAIRQLLEEMRDLQVEQMNHYKDVAERSVAHQEEALARQRSALRSLFFLFVAIAALIWLLMGAPPFGGGT